MPFTSMKSLALTAQGRSGIWYRNKRRVRACFAFVLERKLCIFALDLRFLCRVLGLATKKSWSTILDALSRIFYTTDSSTLPEQYGFIASFKDQLADHPTQQYSLIWVLVGSFLCASMICCSLASEAGSDEITFPLCASISSLSIVDFTVWLRA